jgi:hypothetical protein
VGFRLEHLTADELAAIRRGEQSPSDARSHLYQCLSCRRELADSLLLGRLMGAVSSSRTNDDFPTGHLSPELMTNYHEAAYEADDIDPERFLRIDRHLRQCERCFIAYAKIHQRLSPSPALVEKVARRMRSVTPPIVGTLTVASEVITRLFADFRPAETEDSAWDYRFEWSAPRAARPRGAYSLSGPAIDRPAAASAKFTVADTDLEIELHESHTALRAQIRTLAADTRRPKEGMIIELINEKGDVLEQSKTDRQGLAELHLVPDAIRLRFSSQDKSHASEVRLEVITKS